MIEIKNRWTGEVIYKSDKAKTLRDAVIECANKGKSLASANLAGADLAGANLVGAYLAGADLAGANLADANLADADLAGAYLAGAYLARAKNNKLVVALTRIAPLEGSFVGWKKCRNGVVVKVKIPEKAKRSNAYGRKCRAEYVKVLEVIGAKEGASQHDPTVKYRAGKTVRCDKWDDNYENECSGGIHFFMTREEAEAW